MTMYLLFPLLLMLVCLDDLHGYDKLDLVSRNLKVAFSGFLGDQLYLDGVQRDVESFTATPVETGLDTMSDIAEHVDDFFKKLFDSVKNLKSKIEELYKTENFNGDYQQCCELDESKLEYNSDIMKKSDNTLCVRIARDTDKLIPGSKDLLAAMLDNYDHFKQLKWQYYGTIDGTFVKTPAAKDSSCRSYDPRLRPWFVEAVNPIPKDLVLVIDRSDSLVGERRSIVIKAAQTIINSLNPNDRISLVLFSDDASTPATSNADDACFSSEIAFATPSVKRFYINYLQTIDTGGGTDYEVALKKAFGILAKVDKNSERAKAILFMVDGLPNRGSANTVYATLKQLNAAQNNKVLMLAYSVGDELKDGNSELLLNMANMTSYDPRAGTPLIGRYSHISDTTLLYEQLGFSHNYFNTNKTTTQPIVSVPYTDFSGLGHIFSTCLPVLSDNQLKGATCVDIKLQDLKDTFGFLEDDDIYVFIIDKTSRTLVHPLLPSPGKDISSDPLFVNIDVFEPDAAKSGVLAKILQSLSNNDIFTQVATIKKNVGSPRGNASYDGIDATPQDVTYYWRRINNTDFAVCLVVTKNIQKLKIEFAKTQTAKDFHYHLEYSLGISHPQLYTHYNEIVTKDFQTVQFAVKAYKKQLKGIENKSFVNSLKIYLASSTAPNDYLKDDVKSSVAFLEDVVPFWKSNFPPYIKKKYVSTYHGVYQVYPGIQMDLNFDATKTEWFRKAKEKLNSVVLLRNRAGVTIAQALTVRYSTKSVLWGVIGIDIYEGFFKNLVKNTVADCITGRCLLVDENGFLLYHSDSANNDHRLPLASYEPAISENLISKGILKKNACTDYSWKAVYYTWKVELKESVNNLKNNPYYFFTPVDNTNVYFLFIPNNYTANSFCDYCPSPNYIPKTCALNQQSDCFCPCHSTPAYKPCSNSFILLNNDNDQPCLKSEFAMISTSQLAATSAPDAFPYSCSNEVLKSDQVNCFSYPNCTWCFNGESEACTNIHDCKTYNPGGLSGGAIAGIVIGLLIVIILVLACVWACRKGYCRCLEEMTSDEDGEDGGYDKIAGLNRGLDLQEPNVNGLNMKVIPNQEVDYMHLPQAKPPEDPNNHPDSYLEPVNIGLQTGGEVSTDRKDDAPPPPHSLPPAKPYNYAQNKEVP